VQQLPEDARQGLAGSKILYQIKYLVLAEKSAGFEAAA
jgi:hypothetical protein